MQSWQLDAQEDESKAMMENGRPVWMHVWLLPTPLSRQWCTLREFLGSPYLYRNGLIRRSPANQLDKVMTADGVNEMGMRNSLEKKRRWRGVIYLRAIYVAVERSGSCMDSVGLIQVKEITHSRQYFKARAEGDAFTAYRHPSILSNPSSVPFNHVDGMRQCVDRRAGFC
jgi:hypothetical protein